MRIDPKFTKSVVQFCKRDFSFLSSDSGFVLLQPTAEPERLKGTKFWILNRPQFCLRIGPEQRLVTQSCRVIRLSLGGKTTFKGLENY